jgi:nicotinamide riboside transporter PnuC
MLSKGHNHMRNIRNFRNMRFSTSMGIAITLLVAGIVVQLTDTLQLFGNRSVIPLIIGVIIILVGVAVVLLLRRFVAKDVSK